MFWKVKTREYIIIISYGRKLEAKKKVRHNYDAFIRKNNNKENVLIITGLVT